ncbi:RHS repeat-associated core domain-containing protein [Desulfofarcimen acetoxidans]|uniref:RHS repeat-associated core domain-containing protein n=1 Tax=Desulfofarcimen acetoxidans TaxID=58138 RepID=UPI00019E6672|nr:RHS repeat-associated core domain-containing protein [Desulfofarcimen acetoxidans]
MVQTVAENGTVENQYDYDIFGNPTLATEQYANTIRYAGEFYDSETGLYYLRARYYESYTGRFMSEDSYTGQIDSPLSLNLYTYCENDPINMIDPSGRGKVWNRFGEVIGTTSGSDYTDYSQKATDTHTSKEQASKPWTSSSSSSSTLAVLITAPAADQKVPVVNQAMYHQFQAMAAA